MVGGGECLWAELQRGQPEGQTKRGKSRFSQIAGPAVDWGGQSQPKVRERRARGEGRASPRRRGMTGNRRTDSTRCEQSFVSHRMPLGVSVTAAMARGSVIACDACPVMKGEQAGLMCRLGK